MVNSVVKVTFWGLPKVLTKVLTVNHLYGAESRFNNIRLNDIPGITMEI